MGIIDTISNVLSGWKNRKRKRTDEDGQDEVESQASKKICTYTLTPQEKFIKNNVESQRQRSSVYIYDEEVRTTESRNYEFKAGGVLFGSDNLNRLIQKYGSAFLNSEGGVLLAGVTDDGYVKGVSVSNRDRDSITRTIKYELEKFRPTVSPSMWDIKFVPISFEHMRRPIFNSADRCVVEITFAQGNLNEIYETGEHEVYLRRDGGAQGPLRPLDLKNLVISRYNETLSKRRKESGKNPAAGKLQPKKTADEEKKERLEKKGISYIVISP